MSERLDLAIDEVARQMTERQPPGDFRARIVARLDAGERPRRFWPAVWVLSPIAIGAAIVLAFLVASPFRTRDVAPQRADQTVQPKPGTPTHEATTSEATSEAKKPTGLRDAVHTSIRRPGSFEPGRASALDAIAPQPLDVPALNIAPLAAESIPVAPMETIAPILVVPLPTDDERPRMND